MMSVEPLTGSTFVVAIRVITVPDGATSGIFVQAPGRRAAPTRLLAMTAGSVKPAVWSLCSTMRAIRIRA